MMSNIHTFTSTGKIKRPSYSTVASWVKELWDEVDEVLIQRSFKSCGISTNTDGSEDDCIFDDNLLNDADDEVVEISNNLNDENCEEYPEEANYENEWNVGFDQEEDNEESESEGDDNYDYKDSDDDNEEIQRRLKGLKEKYRVKNFLCLYYFILIYC
jgi:TATA-binding protein-associated factor Taf7